ncbi:MAG: hypothetical protein ABI646_11255, partial [Acidobacteriota bacterium]
TRRRATEAARRESIVCSFAKGDALNTAANREYCSIAAAKGRSLPVHTLSPETNKLYDSLC